MSGVVDKCYITRSVKYRSNYAFSDADLEILDDYKTVPVRNNPLLDSILEQIFTKQTFDIIDPETQNRYRIHGLSKSPNMIVLYQSYLHTDLTKGKMIPISTRRVIITRKI